MKHDGKHVPERQGAAMPEGAAVDGRTPEQANPTELRLHPLARLFPPMSGQEFDNLKTSIQGSGLHDPIVLHKGMILDGRNRYRACQETGVEPRYFEWEGEYPLDYVLTRNLHRRHLTTSQRAMSAAMVIDMFLADARKRQGTSTGGLSPQLRAIAPEAEDKKGRSRDQVGAIFHVSGREVAKALAVRKAGIPDLIDLVMSDQVRLSAALSVAKLPKSEQRDLLRHGATAIAKKLSAKTGRPARGTSKLRAGDPEEDRVRNPSPEVEDCGEPRSCGTTAGDASTSATERTGSQTESDHEEEDRNERSESVCDDNEQEGAQADRADHARSSDHSALGEDTEEETEPCSRSQTESDTESSEDVDIEAEESDEEWLAKLPARYRLADRAVFDADALLWRRAQGTVEGLLRRLHPAPENVMRASIAARTPTSYCSLIALLVAVTHPKHWFNCSECRGRGSLSPTRDVCNACSGVGYQIRFDVDGIEEQ